ncbi:hypothetical protein ART_0407 [Arthrobacter sp. PAMC 25486]|nr:hypothetical protein ART_0407 [Arthrobacter sp. PAMC 25486]
MRGSCAVALQPFHVLRSVARVDHTNLSDPPELADLDKN